MLKKVGGTIDLENMFKTFFDFAPNAVIAVKSDGKIIAASQQALKLFGYTEGELKDEFIEMLMPNRFRHGHEKHRDAFLLNPQSPKMGFGIDFIAQRKDGTSFYAEIGLSAVDVDGEKIILTAIQDITEKRDLYNQLKVSNEQFKGAFEYSAIGMALVSTEGKWLKVNKSVCDTVGYEEEELLRTTFQEITHPEDLDIDLELLGEMLRGERETYQMEKRYFHKQGHIVWVLLNVSMAKDADGNLLHFVSQIKNISESKLAEKALKESEQRWQFALEGSGEGVWDWNAKTNKVFFSRQWKKLVGYEDHEIGDNLEEWSKRVHPEDIKQCNADLSKHMRGETPLYLNEHRLLCKDGKYKWILDRGKVIERDSDGKPLRIIGTHNDISLQKLKEKELRQSIETISEQNARLMNFAHIVSHNLRSHTGNFQLLVDLLSKEDDEQERKQMIHFLKENANSLNETIKHLNDVVQIQINTNIIREKLSLKQYISKVTDVLRAELNKNNTTVHNNVAADVYINYNPAYLESILLNFISNGMKYRHKERPAQIVLSTNMVDNKLVLNIADNGVGINLEKYKEKLFGLYKTFHGNSDARGVGLFITKNQIEAMGGKIEVESEINIGTTFKILFI